MSVENNFYNINIHLYTQLINVQDQVKIVQFHLGSFTRFFHFISHIYTRKKNLLTAYRKIFPNNYLYHRVLLFNLISRQIWNQTDLCLVPNQSEKSVITIQIWLNLIILRNKLIIVLICTVTTCNATPRTHGRWQGKKGSIMIVREIFVICAFIYVRIIDT